MMVVMTTDNRQRTTDDGQQTTDRVSACECYVNLHTNPPASAAELKTKFTSELKIQNSEFKLHPCVEINLRLNMGIIAHEVHRKLLAPGVEGRFHVAAFPTQEAAQHFHREYTEKYPPVYREGKMMSGYHPLTPLYPHTRHHAYIICG